LLTTSTNKSKTSWNIADNETGTAANKKIIQTEFKLGSKIISTKQSHKFFNSHILDYVDELITQQPNSESAMFSVRKSFHYEFPQIINIPVTETEIICIVSSLKNTTLYGFDGLYNKILKLHRSQISKYIT